MQITIREINESDIDDVLEIEREAFTTPWSENAFKSEIKNNLAYYLVAVVEEKAIAYGGMWLILDEAHITNIAVKEEYKGNGIGNDLLEGLIEKSMDLKIMNMTLEVRESNQIARNLYEKHGFLSYGTRAEYYADDKEDAVIMWRSNNI